MTVYLFINREREIERLARCCLFFSRSLGNLPVLKPRSAKAYSTGTASFMKSRNGCLWMKCERPLEIDVLAESNDKSALLVGEVKWSETSNGDELENLLEQKCRNFPLSHDKTMVKALFLKKKIALRDANVHVLAPDDIVAVSV
ncbi:MAG: hypothetical protein NT004_10755 [Bacteroidetes bacterium]|nr:hypothetical protein [Bacteroidota bacterium]